MTVQKYLVYVLWNPDFLCEVFFLERVRAAATQTKKRFLSGAPFFAFFHCSDSFISSAGNILFAISTMLRQKRKSVKRNAEFTRASFLSSSRHDSETQAESFNLIINYPLPKVQGIRHENGILRIVARCLSLVERIECEQKDTFFPQAHLWANLVLKAIEPARDGLEVELSQWICIQACRIFFLYLAQECRHKWGIALAWSKDLPWSWRCPRPKCNRTCNIWWGSLCLGEGTVDLYWDSVTSSNPSCFLALHSVTETLCKTLDNLKVHGASEIKLKLKKKRLSYICLCGIYTCPIEVMY